MAERQSLLGDSRDDALPSVETIIEEEDIGSLPGGREGASTLQAAFSVINIFVGVGLLSMPYALREAGWIGLAALAAAVTLFCMSGKLIVRAFDALPPHVPKTYPNLGVQALGPNGKYVVAAFAVAEFFGGSCLMLVVQWKQLVAVLPPGNADIGGMSTFHTAVLASLVLTTPLLLVTSLKNLSWLNLVGCMSTALVTLMVVGSVALDPDRSRQPIQPPAGYDWVRLGIVQAVGIFALSVSGHSSLPVVRMSMKRPQDFDKVLNLSFGFMLVIYSSIAGFGYYYYGRDASELVTADLAINSPFSGVSIIIPGLTVDKLVSGCILINAYTTYPSLLVVIQDMVWSISRFAEGGRRPTYAVCVTLRMLTFVLGAIIAFTAYDNLGNIASLVGGTASLSCSLLMPSLFFLLLFRDQLHTSQAAAIIAMLAFGVAMLLLVVVQNVFDIMQKQEDISQAGLTFGEALAAATTQIFRPTA